MRRLPLFFLLLTACVALSAFRTPEERMAGIAALHAQADSGLPEALYHLSMLYERGYDTIPADSLRAMRLLTASADSGYLPALNYLGYRLMQRGETAEGLRRIEEAAIAGDPKAQSNIGFLLLQGKLVARDDEKALYWLSRAADAGVATAASMLGDLYRDGRGGVTPDTLRAADYYRAALDHGLLDAAYKLEALQGPLWARSDASEQLRVALYLYPARAPQIAIPILKRIADSADFPAQVRARADALLGDAYSRAIGVDYDHDLSLRHFWRAAEAGYAPAQFVIAELLEIFPDALLPLTDSPPSAAELREAALAQGISTAADATTRLFLAPEAQENLDSIY